MPKDISAEVMFASVEEYAGLRRASKPVVTDVRFVNIDDPTVEVFKQEFEFLFEIDDNTPGQDEARDKNVQREPKMNEVRRDSKGHYNPPRNQTGHINPDNKPYGGAAMERTGGKISSNSEKRSFRQNTSQSKAFTHVKVLNHSFGGKNSSSSPLSYSGAVAGKSSSFSSVKDQDPQRKTSGGKENQGTSFFCMNVKCHTKTMTTSPRLKPGHSLMA